MNEAFVFEGDGGLIPARIAEAPWLGALEPRGPDVSVVLETERGRTVTIRGQTVLSTSHVMGPEVGGGFHLQQAIARHVGG